jgi:hypothetical protein
MGLVFDPDYPKNTLYHQDFMLCVQTTHATYMKDEPLFRVDNSNTIRALNANNASLYMGYNYLVTNITVTISTMIPNSVDLEVAVQQIGVAPFYYPLALELSCIGLMTPISLNGVETIIDMNEIKYFLYRNIPATMECLQSFVLSLRSHRFYPDRPMKFAQGIDGAVVRFSVPLPPRTNTSYPTRTPTSITTNPPSFDPTMGSNTNPSLVPTMGSSTNPSLVPSVGSSTNPSLVPSVGSSTNPTLIRSSSITTNPTLVPSRIPTSRITGIETSMCNIYTPCITPSSNIPSITASNTTNNPSNVPTTPTMDPTDVTTPPSNNNTQRTPDSVTSGTVQVSRSPPLGWSYYLFGCGIIVLVHFLIVPIVLL